MGYQYSPSQNIFVESSLKDSYLNNDYPADAVDVDESLFLEFSAAAPAGKIRVAGTDGMPAWGDIPPPTREELIMLAEIKKQSLLDEATARTADWRTELALDIISDEDRESLIAWMQYIKALKAVDVSALPLDKWPSAPD